MWAAAERTARTLLAGLAVLVAPVLAAAQTDTGAEPGYTPAAPATAVESYLERLGLRTLLADQLADRLTTAQGEERRAIAERLAAIYVEQLAAAATPEQRAAWEQRSRDLLRQVPEVDSYELRLNLARVIYVAAEEVLERHRLRLATEEEAAEAGRSLRAIAPEVADLATKLHGRVESYERLEESVGGSRDAETIAQNLADARRLRSQAFYYSGWIQYSLAYLTRNERHAVEALKSFGWLLNARGGNPASPERVSAGLFKYEHVARAAIGCALAASLRGADVEAVRWLDAVAGAPELPASVQEQILPRRITILAAAKRWADLERAIRLARRSDRSGAGPEVQPLSVVAARLLAIVSLEADPATRHVTEKLAAIALGDLVTAGEVAQVLDLVKRYGTLPIGDTGFIVHYVRGMQIYENTRDAHRAAGRPDEPAEAPELINNYRQAAALLADALRQPDAANFGNEGSRAAMIVGLCHYYAGEFADAADRFLESWRSATTPDAGEEPLWLAVLALDRAVRAGETSVRPRRDEAAALYLKTYAGTERAARLLVGLGSSGLLEDEAAVRILLGVPTGSPVYAHARREAARLLYAMYRRARDGERDFAATRFLAVAEELLAADRRVVASGSAEEARAAADAVVLRVRQILDAVLGSSTPDLGRAESALRTLDEVAAIAGLDLSGHEAELTFRRLQILLARGDTDAAEQLASQIETQRGPFADAAVRMLYRAAATAVQRAGDGATDEQLLNVVRHGRRIIERSGSTPAALADAATLSLHSVVADAAMRLYDRSKDESMRDLALTLDRAILKAVPRSEAALRRVARLAEEAGEEAEALESWRLLLAGAQAGTPAWYEARYHSIRLLARTDLVRAREAMRQHKVLYPSLGPPPWGDKLRELDAELGEAPAPAPSGGNGPQGGDR